METPFFIFTVIVINNIMGHIVTLGSRKILSDSFFIVF